MKLKLTLLGLLTPSLLFGSTVYTQGKYKIDEIKMKINSYEVEEYLIDTGSETPWADRLEIKSKGLYGYELRKLQNGRWAACRRCIWFNRW